MSNTHTIRKQHYCDCCNIPIPAKALRDHHGQLRWCGISYLMDPDTGKIIAVRCPSCSLEQDDVRITGGQIPTNREVHQHGYKVTEE